MNETRYIPRELAGLSVRADDDKPKVIEGYGAVFYNPNDPGTEYKLWRDTYERIAPGAFDRALQEDDVRSLFNHDSNYVLGRNTADTLALSVDSVGLRYAATPPGTNTINDLVVSPIDRGDVDGSSFMFEPLKVAWIEEDRDGVMFEIREIQEVRLWEVGPVVFPAYRSATSGVRAKQDDMESIKAERRQWKDAGKPSDPFDFSVRLRMLKIDEQQLGI